MSSTWHACQTTCQGFVKYHEQGVWHLWKNTISNVLLGENIYVCTSSIAIMDLADFSEEEEEPTTPHKHKGTAAVEKEAFSRHGICICIYVKNLSCFAEFS